MTEAQELAPVETPKTAVALTAITPVQMLVIAVEQGADIDKLTKLMDLQERWEGNEARKQYTAAMAVFRADCPKIERDQSGHNNKYAGLAGSIEQIKQLMSDCGLSHRWETSQESKDITVKCIVTHKGGHAESTRLTAQPDTSGSKNAIQAIGSTVAYLERYTLFAIMGLASKEMDDDGVASDPEGFASKILERLLVHQEILRDNISSVYCIKESLANKDWDSADEAWQELTEDEQRGLWVAPSKGGIFTTEERKLLKNEGRDA